MKCFRLYANTLNVTKHSYLIYDHSTKNKPPLKRGKVGSTFLMREKQKGYSYCTPIKWCFVKIPLNRDIAANPLLCLSRMRNCLPPFTLIKWRFVILLDACVVRRWSTWSRIMSGSVAVWILMIRHHSTQVASFERYDDVYIDDSCIALVFYLLYFLKKSTFFSISTHYSVIFFFLFICLFSVCFVFYTYYSYNLIFAFPS